MINKVHTYGCSVSSYFSTSKTYTDYLTDKLYSNGINHSMTCGSNDRSMRLVNKHILNREITEHDLILFQYTSSERKEFWSRHKAFIEPTHKNDIFRESFLDGELFHYKIGVYGDVTIEQKFTKLYEDNFVDPLYDAEHMRGRHAGLVSLCDIKRIPIIFLVGYANQMFSNWKTVDDEVGVDRFMVVSYEDLLEDKNMTSVNKDGTVDKFHFNEKGHEEISNRIFRILKENNLA